MGNPIYFRRFFVIAAILLVLCVLALYNVNRFHVYKGHRLKLVSVSENGVVMTDNSGGELVLSMESANVTPWEMLGVTCTVRYLSETIRYSSSIDTWSSTTVFSDGSEITEDMIQMQISDSITPATESALTQSQLEEKRLLEKLLDFLQTERPLSLYVGYTVIGFLLLLLGTWLLFYPDRFWRLEMMFQVKNGEPTDWAILSNRIAGGLLIAATYIGAFYSLHFA